MGKHPQDRAQRRKMKQDHMNGHEFNPHTKRRAQAVIEDEESRHELKTYLGKVLPDADVEGIA